VQERTEGSSIGHWIIGQLVIAELVNFQAFARGRRVQGRTEGSSIGHCIRQARARTNRRKFNWSLHKAGVCKDGQKGVPLVIA